MRRLCFSLLLILSPAAAWAQTPEIMTGCEIGAFVTSPGFATPGQITAEKSGMCVVDMNGETTVLLPAQMTRAEGPGPAATEGLEAIGKGGYWTCLDAAGAPVFDMYLTRMNYDAMGLGTGDIREVTGDATAFTFTGGPLDGVPATVTASVLAFTPPGASAPATCRIRP